MTKPVEVTLNPHIHRVEVRFFRGDWFGEVSLAILDDDTWELEITATEEESPCDVTITPNLFKAMWNTVKAYADLRDLFPPQSGVTAVTVNFIEKTVSAWAKKGRRVTANFTTNDDKTVSITPVNAYRVKEDEIDSVVEEVIRPVVEKIHSDIGKD